MWVGYRSINKPLENIEGFGAVYGGTIPAQIWKDFMTTATRRAAARTTGPSPSIPMVYRTFTADDVVRLQPVAAGGAGAPAEAKKKPKDAAAAPPTQVVIAPQNC